MHASTTPVFSLHYVGINLKRGVASERFEAFVRHKGVAIPAYPGWRWTLLRGLRGERENQYLMVYQAKDAATYARYIDGNGELTDEANAFWRQRPEAAALIEEWKTFATFAELPTLYTCYRLVAENSRSSLPPGPNYRSEPGKESIQRVIGIHNLALKAGVSPEQFERFITDNIHRVEDYPGWKFHLLKGQSGNRLDQYAVMLIIESLASLNAFHPELDVSTEQALRFVAEHQDTERMYDEWKTLASFSGAPQIYTDYLAIGGNENDAHPA
ncbi:hypothetical protein FOT57_10865 [Serratia ureilytica]|uniref:hypothetical protein n=1 Tax=Serratia ureilytica TaxID=300181 RepID=UPI0011CA88ED|nr:hypothetical protein [Serratia ureilytica]TXE57497.1 hypothetical protein FOT57_10865 [Serratia ureilytica]